MFQNITALNDYISNLGLTLAMRKKVDQKAFSVNITEKTEKTKDSWTSEEYVDERNSGRDQAEDYRYGRILRKLEGGKLLTEDEMEYLAVRYVQKYKEAQEIYKERSRYEQQLATCQYREDVEKTKIAAKGKWLEEANAVARKPYLEEFVKYHFIIKIYSIINQLADAHNLFLESEIYRHMPARKATSKGEILESYDTTNVYVSNDSTHIQVKEPGISASKRGSQAYMDNCISCNDDSAVNTSGRTFDKKI